MQLRSIVLFVPLATSLVYACSGEPEPPAVPPGYEDVVLEGSVSKATLTAFVGALEAGPPVVMPTRTPALFWPSDGEKLPLSPVTSFCWELGKTARRAPQEEEGARWVGLSPAPARSFAALASPLRELIGPPRAAHAAGEPWSGIATYVVFSTDTEPKLLRALTSELHFTPTEATWKQWAAMGKMIRVSLVAAGINQGQVEGGVVVEGSSIAFGISL